MTKYKKYCQNMLKEHKELFDQFRKLHDEFALNPDKLQNEFNQMGIEIMSIVKDWEDRLCGASETAGYASFTASLAEKFMGEVRREFPMIDRVGVITKKMKPLKKREITLPGAAPAFELNQISPRSQGFNLKKIEF